MLWSRLSVKAPNNEPLPKQKKKKKKPNKTQPNQTKHNQNTQNSQKLLTLLLNFYAINEFLLVDIRPALS